MQKSRSDASSMKDQGPSQKNQLKMKFGLKILNSHKKTEKDTGWFEVVNVHCECSESIWATDFKVFTD